MSNTEATEIARGAEIERRAPILPTRPDILSDDEMRRLYRLAEGLTLSRVYKDITQASQALAKLIVGNELGLNISQSMSIYFVEGQVTVPYPLLGMFVREHGFDFRYLTLTDELVEIEFGRGIAPGRDEEGKWIYWPAAIDVSRFSVDDAVKAQIAVRTKDGALVTKNNKTSMYEKFGRNMLIARAMANGVRWFAQEATGGVPLYVPGEIEERPALTSGEGSGESQGLDLGPKVEAILARAAELGHAGLSDRATAEVALGQRSPAAVGEWVARASAELDRFEAERPPEAEVVEADVPIDIEGLPEPTEAPVGSGEPLGAAAEGPDVESLRRRLSDLLDKRTGVEEAPGGYSETESALGELDAEIAFVEEELRAAGGSVPGQESLDLG